MSNLNDTAVFRAIDIKKGVFKRLKELFVTKFADFSIPIYESMKFLDPKSWTDRSNINHNFSFQNPLKGSQI